MPALPSALIPSQISPIGVRKHSAEILRKAEQLRPDVLLLPTDLEGYPLFALLPQLRARVPATKTLVIIDRRDRKFVVTILRQGAKGCVRPTSAPASFANAILAAKSGDIWLERKILAKALGDLMRAKDVGETPKAEPIPSAARHGPPLTHREQQVAAGVNPHLKTVTTNPGGVAGAGNSCTNNKNCKTFTFKTTGKP
jgi:Response regulator containing a CheY-like receiver domain and an HTH DNA-binding domain